MRLAGGLVRTTETRILNTRSFRFIEETAGKEQRYSHRDEKPRKTAAVIRSGAIGDVPTGIVHPASPEGTGYHVTFYTVPGGYEVMKNDPHIDRFIVRAKTRFPIITWATSGSTRLRNTTASSTFRVRGRTWFAVPDKTFHSWPDNVRKKVPPDRNYMEFVHDLAEVPTFPGSSSTRPQKKNGRARNTSVWGLHPMPCPIVPYTGVVLMDNPHCKGFAQTDLKIVTTGGEIEWILEQGGIRKPRNKLNGK